MNKRVAKRIRKGTDTTTDYRRAKKEYNKKEPQPVVINFGKRHKGESLDDFGERREKVNRKKRLRRDRHKKK